MNVGDAAASAGQDTTDAVDVVVRSDGDDTIGGSAANRRPTITPPRDGTEGQAAELRETAAFRAAVEALRAAVDQLEGEPGRDAAAAAWHAESVVRFFCSTYDGAVTAVRVNEDNFIVVSATVPGDDVTDVTISVGPDGTCACKVSTAN